MGARRDLLWRLRGEKVFGEQNSGVAVCGHGQGTQSGGNQAVAGQAARLVFWQKALLCALRRKRFVHEHNGQAGRCPRGSEYVSLRA